MGINVVELSIEKINLEPPLNALVIFLIQLKLPLIIYNNIVCGIDANQGNPAAQPTSQYE